MSTQSWAKLHSPVAPFFSLFGVRGIITPVAVPRRKAEDGDGEEPVVLGSDVEDDVEPVVDTDVESDAESEGSDASSADGIAELKAATLRKFLHTAPVPQPLAKPKATGDPRQPTTVPL